MEPAWTQFCLPGLQLQPVQGWKNAQLATVPMHDGSQHYDVSWEGMQGCTGVSGRRDSAGLRAPSLATEAQVIFRRPAPPVGLAALLLPSHRAPALVAKALHDFTLVRVDPRGERPAALA